MSNDAEKSLGILFDFNGVIANDEDVHENAFRNVLSKQGIVLSEKMYKRFCLGRTDKEGFEQLKRKLTKELLNRPVDSLVLLKQEEGYPRKAGHHMASTT